MASITANVAAMSGVDVGKSVGCGMGTNVGCGVDVDANVGVGVDVRVGCGVGVGVDVACCAWSSSVIVSIVLMVARSSMPSAALPDTVSFRSGSSLLLSTAVMIQVPMLDIMPGGMVNVLPDTVTNSGSSDDIDTLIVVAATEAVSSVAVTALLPPFSEMEVSDSASVTTGIATPGAGGCGSACPVLRMRLPLVAIWIPAVSASPSAPQQTATPSVFSAQACCTPISNELKVPRLRRAVNLIGEVRPPALDLARLVSAPHNCAGTPAGGADVSEDRIRKLRLHGCLIRAAPTFRLAVVRAVLHRRASAKETRIYRAEGNRRQLIRHRGQLDASL